MKLKLNVYMDLYCAILTLILMIYTYSFVEETFQ